MRTMLVVAMMLCACGAKAKDPDLVSQRKQPSRDAVEKSSTEIAQEERDRIRLELTMDPRAVLRSLEFDDGAIKTIARSLDGSGDELARIKLLASRDPLRALAELGVTADDIAGTVRAISPPCPAPPPPLPPLAPSPAGSTSGWWCSQGGAGSSQSSNCERDKTDCEQYAAKMSGKGYDFGECFKVPVAACFKARDTLGRGVFEMCTVVMSHCISSLDFRRKYAQQDWTVVSNCQATK